MKAVDIASAIRELLSNAFGRRLRRVVLYGSCARAEESPESDLDLLVLLDGPVRLGEDLDTILKAIYPVQLELDRAIHILPVDLATFEAGQFPLYRNAKREGLLL